MTEAAETVPQLPPLLSEIAEATSVGAAMKLVSDFGGTRVYVPRKPPKNSPLTKSVGARNAAAIARLYGGEHLEVPLLSAASRARAIEATAQLLGQGYSHEQVARKLRIHRKTVQRRAKKIDGAPPLPLFDDPDE